MAFWSRLRSLLGLGERSASPQDGAGAATAAPAATAGTDLAAATGGTSSEEPLATGDSDEEDDAPVPTGVLAGVIDDWTATTATGLITLTDGAELRFGREACRQFTPLIGLRIEVLATGIPRADSAAETAASPHPTAALWATRVRLAPGSESEYAARLRISQVERAVRGQVERVINAPSGAAAPTSAPPWARNKAGKKPAGPARPPDGFFVLTVVLGRELPEQPAALAALLDSPVWPKPAVRIIPLARKGQPEAGFSAEITAAEKRAFLLYRPLPYAAADTPPQGVGHVGLFVGGPHSPRVLAKLHAGAATAPLPLSQGGEPRLVAALARALLLGEPAALGLVVNRAGKAWKPREIALSQLGPAVVDPEENNAAAAPPAVPFLLFIDWNVGERDGVRCQRSAGMESLGLPDVAVLFTGDSAQDRARDALWFACHELAAGRLLPTEQTLYVPRRLLLLPGSRLRPDATAESALYRVKQRDEQWLELIEADDPGALA